MVFWAVTVLTSNFFIFIKWGRFKQENARINCRKALEDSGRAINDAPKSCLSSLCFLCKFSTKNYVKQHFSIIQTSSVKTNVPAYSYEVYILLKCHFKQFFCKKNVKNVPRHDFGSTLTARPLSSTCFQHFCLFTLYSFRHFPRFITTSVNRPKY